MNQIGDLRIIKRGNKQVVQTLSRITHEAGGRIFLWEDYLNVFCRTTLAREEYDYHPLSYFVDLEEITSLPETEQEEAEKK